ncbi:cyclase [Methanobacterium paludis]|uniref:Cyclase/dehydrase n=1 Tax=Methanobacterium paludis (strain DSM 25820 / JCM 18151 / SWAN1) TaxID=868131 RepID=F6D369_METPW|nr:cyclase [Methanobacterium paludis]AEG18009.1 cyclase/dehydrase [Methanobacterium paludis]
MTYVLVIHKVKDYAKWKPVYDEDGATRKAKGSKGSSLFRNANDPNHLIVLTEFEDMEKAKSFVESEDLKIAMQKAGVAGRPAVFYLEKLAKSTY